MYAKSILEWAKLKIYQYEVTTGLYMLEPFEKMLWNSLFGILFLLVTSSLLKVIL
jgi:hypothetical protein